MAERSARRLISASKSADMWDSLRVRKWVRPLVPMSVGRTAKQ